MGTIAFSFSARTRRDALKIGRVQRTLNYAPGSRASTRSSAYCADKESDTMATSAAAAAREPATVGHLLRHWRHVRRKSQLSLALQAGISARHLGFVEIGRAAPSREMVLLLAGVLDVPLRERNALLLAAGYAPLYRETGLEAPEMEHARRAVALILEHQEPYPAVVMDRHWNILTANAAAQRFFSRLLPASSEGAPANIIRLMFDPRGLRPWVANWEGAAEALVHRIHREALGGVPDGETARLLEEVLSYPDVPKRWRLLDLLAPFPSPYLALQFRKGDLAMDFFSTVTTLGTPLDVTLQEIRIECFFPADDATAKSARAMAAAAATPG
jgi:transcriptional regulator with XRE-family HTH domain